MPVKTTVPIFAKKLGDILVKKQLRCAVAESCTGGSLAAAMTEIPGSSEWFDRGFVTYSNRSKQELLGVSAEIIDEYGAVSEETVRAMAQGVLTVSDAQVSVAISGVAGPGGGSVEKPVGMVWIAWAWPQHSIDSHCFMLSGDRISIRNQAVFLALEGMINRCSSV